MACIDDAVTTSNTNDDKIFDLDIYSDFITTENEESDVVKKYQDLLKVCEELKQTNENLEKQNKILLENISKLYKTAKYELYQKNLKLKGLKQELDAVIFRRDVKHGKCNVSTANVGCNFSLNKNRNFNDKKFNTSNIQQYGNNSENNFNATRKHIIAQKMNCVVPKAPTSATEMLLRYHCNPKRKMSKTCDFQPKLEEIALNQMKTNEIIKTNNAFRSDVETRTNIDEVNENNEISINPINKSPVIDASKTDNHVINAKSEEKIMRHRNQGDSGKDVKPRMNRFNHHKSDVVRKADAIKRKIRRNSASPRKNNDGKNISPKKRKEIEDGEILSDSEETLKKRHREDRNTRKFDTNGRDDYKHQLEMNRIKMQIRREKVLLSKAREEMNSKDRKYR